jgi:hypothetical protein
VALLGYMKSVDRSLGCTTDLAPDWLVQIEDRIDEVAQAEQWRQSAGCYHPRESGRSAP